MLTVSARLETYGIVQSKGGKLLAEEGWNFNSVSVSVQYDFAYWSWYNFEISDSKLHDISLTFGREDQEGLSVSCDMLRVSAHFETYGIVQSNWGKFLTKELWNYNTVSVSVWYDFAYWSRYNFEISDSKVLDIFLIFKGWSWRNAN